MFKCARVATAVFVLCAGMAWGQKAAEGEGTKVAARHEIPIDKLGNVVRISGRCNSKAQDMATNGRLEIRFPRGDVRSVQAFAGKVAVSGAVIDRRSVETKRLIKSSVDYVTINAANNAVEFSTRSQDGVLTLPLAAEKDAQVVVAVYIETINGPVGFRYFLNPRGLSVEPVKKEGKKKAKN